jgi:hypothetical protein
MNRNPHISYRTARTWLDLPRDFTEAELRARAAELRAAIHSECGAHSAEARDLEHAVEVLRSPAAAPVWQRLAQPMMVAIALISVAVAGFVPASVPTESDFCVPLDSSYIIQDVAPGPIPYGAPFEADLYPGHTSASLDMAFKKTQYLTPSPDKTPYSAVLELPAPPKGAMATRFKINAALRNMAAPEADTLETFERKIRIPANQEDDYPGYETEVLYRHCSNSLRYDVPHLRHYMDGKYYHPHVKAVGGRFFKGEDNLVTVDPLDDKFGMVFSNIVEGDTIEFARKAFRAERPPKPELRILKDGEPWDPAEPVSKRAVFNIIVVPDERFEKYYPSDCRYQIGEIRFLLKSKIGQFQTVHTLLPTEIRASPNADFTLSDILYQIGDIPEGEKLYVEIDRIKRYNYRDKVGIVPFNRREMVKIIENVDE